MHTLLALSSVLLVLLGGYGAIVILRRVGGGPRRREVQLAVLMAPLASLGLGVGGLYHFAGRPCLLDAPRWDATLAVALPLGTALIAFGGLGLGLVRLAIMDRVLARRAVPASPALQAVVDRLAGRLEVTRPRVLLCTYDRPLALACGLRRPTVLLSTWMVDQLDPHELESALAHELAHVARHDYLAVWVATVLRDAFFYLPTSWAVYRQLQHEKELACDDLAADVTGRPLALASALAKVWQSMVGGLNFGTAQPLVGAGDPIETRVERLLSGREPSAGRRRSRVVVLGTGAVALAGLLALEAATVTLVLVSLGCGPASSAGRLF